MSEQLLPDPVVRTLKRAMTLELLIGRTRLG